MTGMAAVSCRGRVDPCGSARPRGLPASHWCCPDQVPGHDGRIKPLPSSESIALEELTLNGVVVRCSKGAFSLAKQPLVETRLADHRL
jgi:hypothetical protein